jgi:predicted nucleic acid-binding protein
MSGDKAVCNSGPLIALSSIHQLDLLNILFDRVIVPEAVYREVVSQGKGRPGHLELKNAGWIQRTRVEKTPLLKVLSETLGPGESEAIALATEIQTDYVVLDERIGRRYAFRLDLRVVGTLGILIMGKKKGILPKVLPLIDSLQNHSFRISGKIRKMIANDAGE